MLSTCVRLALNTCQLRVPDLQPKKKSFSFIKVIVARIRDKSRSLLTHLFWEPKIALCRRDDAFRFAEHNECSDRLFTWRSLILGHEATVFTNFFERVLLINCVVGLPISEWYSQIQNWTLLLIKKRKVSLTIWQLAAYEIILSSFFILVFNRSEKKRIFDFSLGWDYFWTVICLSNISIHKSHQHFGNWWVHSVAACCCVYDYTSSYAQPVQVARGMHRKIIQSKTTIYWFFIV